MITTVPSPRDPRVFARVADHPGGFAITFHRRHVRRTRVIGSQVVDAPRHVVLDLVCDLLAQGAV